VYPKEYIIVLLSFLKTRALSHNQCSLARHGTVDFTNANKKTRKLCYRKDDRAMRPIHGALKIFPDFSVS